MTSVQFGKGLTSIGKEAFTYDGGLKTIDLTPATNLSLINDGAFEYSGLSGALTIPDGVTTIGNQAFSGDHLTSLTLGKNVQTVGNESFFI
jgi:hypothetical protein